NLGFLLLVALMLIGLIMLAYAVGIGIFFGFFFTAMKGKADPTLLMIGIPVVLVLAVIALVVYSWIDAGLAIAAVGLCRGSHVQFGDVFSGGRYTLQILLLNILLGVINFGISFVCGMAGQAAAAAAREPPVALSGTLLAYVVNYVVAWLFLLLAKLFIVDRDLDVIQAISASIRYMRGNKLTVFVIHLVAGAASLAAFLFTCGVGWLFVIPFWMILTAMIYLFVTGQPIALHARENVPHRAGMSR
ncbi:MAG: hypothetical protein JJ992_30585, partial [Planctomycetes bacterium]|nr:hypothetical protein [Planctomycetota bacterium]